MDPRDRAAAPQREQPERVEDDGHGNGQPGGAVPSAQIVPKEDQQELRTEIEHPARLLRIATAVQTLFQEVKTTELDEAARQRLTDIHNRTIEDLRGLVSSDLEGELDAFTLEIDDGTPSGPELRVMQAQLAGWLQGVFHGIQATVASQQMAAQQQLAQMRQQGEGTQAGPGQYL